MSEEQIATMLGRLLGELRAHREEFARYQDDHNDRHDKIDEKIDEHSAQINQAKGAKGTLLAIAGLIGGLVAAAAKKLFP